MQHHPKQVWGEPWSCTVLYVLYCIVALYAHLAQAEKGRVKAFPEVPVGHGGENLGHGGVVKGLDGDEVEVAGEAVGDVVPTTSWRSHGTHQSLQGGGGNMEVVTYVAGARPHIHVCTYIL